MAANKIDNFNEVSPLLFVPLLKKFGFELKETRTFYHNNQKWAAHHNYINKSAKLKIVIMQEPYYTDYGFSFYLYNTSKSEYNILYNVPHEDQDQGDLFLQKACDNIFSNKESIDMISGKSWKQSNILPEKI